MVRLTLAVASLICFLTCSVHASKRLKICMLSWMFGRPKAHMHTARIWMWHARACGDGCKQCKIIFSESSSIQLSVLPTNQSHVKGVACKISERSGSWNQCCRARWAGKVDIQACVVDMKLLSSSLQEASFWPKNALRSDLIASKFNTSLIDVCAYTHAIVIWPIDITYAWPLEIWWLWPWGVLKYSKLPHQSN